MSVLPDKIPWTGSGLPFRWFYHPGRWRGAGRAPAPWDLPLAVYRHLPGGTPGRYGKVHWRDYPTQEAAMEALALASF